MFTYNDIRFADIQMLRYRVDGFERLSLRQKKLVYCLAEAALWGRDILFDQNCCHNLAIRRVLERIYVSDAIDHATEEFAALQEYLRRVWFSNGIHHHYGCDKFVPGFSEEYFRRCMKEAGYSDALFDELRPIIFDPAVLPKRVNLKDGDDLLQTSACNYYQDGITQREAETFYNNKKHTEDTISYGLNSRLERDDNGELCENTYRVGGMYGETIERIVMWLERARDFAENPQQAKVIDLLVEFYITGDLHTFEQYTIEWVRDTVSLVDFTNGFTETYGDPLGIKASWEGYVNFKDVEATRRTDIICRNAQWFEDNSPVDDRFKKKEVRGVSAKVIKAAIIGGDLYPSTAIGINLPNSDWVRKEYGSKSVTIGNFTEAYNRASHGNGFYDEFVPYIKDNSVSSVGTDIRELIDHYGDLCDDLHTDLHECLGHGSGQLLPGTDPDALGAYGSTMEEARADLFALYYLADAKLVELGLLPAPEAYKAHYYTYLLNGAMTQLVRIAVGSHIEEAHMRNRALIANWVLAFGDGIVSLQTIEDNDARDTTFNTECGIKRKTVLVVNDYERLRTLFARLLAEVQRIKSMGDYLAARALVETYGVQVDASLHREVIARYARLDIAPYKGFINPRYILVFDDAHNIKDITVTYDEPYDVQMLRYSRDYCVALDS